MNFPIVKQYKFDIDGTNLDNKVTDEPIKTPAGIFNRVIVPVNGPFFVDDLVLTSLNGKPLVEEEDYRIFRMMGKLTEFCAKDVACMIELIKPEITDVLATYQVVGDTTLFDRSLLVLIMNAVNDDRWVQWQYVNNKPPAFPPTLHGHSILYEMAAFQDMVSMVDELIAYLSTNHRDILEIKVDHLSSLIVWYFNLYTQMLTDYSARHQKAYNAHGLTAKQVNAELIDNVKTATLTQALQGERDDLVMTIPGLQALVQQYGYNDDFYLETNVIPLSRYGSRNFIPPSVDGSFEGLGSQSEALGLCEEGTGELTILNNHFDGRRKGLYFSVLKDAEDYTYEFTGYRYDHQVLRGDGVVPDTVILGSNNNALMIGVRGTNSWYLTAARNTFNPSKHVLCRVDLTAVYADMGTSVVAEPRYLSIHYYGKWMYLLFGKPGDDGDMDKVFFYRVLTSTVEAGQTAVFSRINVSFTSYDGDVFTNSTFFKGFKRLKDANGKVTRSFFNYVPYVTNDAVNSWNPVVMSYYDKSGKTPNLLRFQYYQQGNFSEGSKVIFNEQRPVIIYEFNPETGAMTLRDKTPGGTINFNTMTAAQIDAFRIERGLQWSELRLNGGYAFNQIPLSNGKFLATITSGATPYPPGFRIVDFNKKSRFEYMSVAPTAANCPTQTWRHVSGMIPSPLLNNVKPTTMMYHSTTKGELFSGLNQSPTDNEYVLFFRQVDGGYQQREGVTNVNYPILSRPLVNRVLKTDIKRNSPFIALSASSSRLAQYNATMGDVLFAPLIMVNNKQVTTTWAEPGRDGAAQLTPSFFSISEINGRMKTTIGTWYGWPQSVLDYLYGLIPAQSVGTGTKFVEIYPIQNGKFSNVYRGASMAFVLLGWHDAATASITCQWLVCSMTVEPNNASHPGIDMVTNLTLKSRGVTIRFGNVVSPVRLEMLYSDKLPSMQLYYGDDGKLDVGVASALSLSVLGDSQSVGSRFNVDPADMVLRAEVSRIYGWTQQDGAAFMAIPDVGITTLQSGEESGYAALMSRSVAGNRYLLVSPYPESGWTVYFQKPQPVVFNGTEYTLPAGTMDLRDVDPSPANKTFYLYCQLRSGSPEYQISALKLGDTPFHMWIGTITTNEKQILNIERFNVFTLNGLRVSETKRGSALPASSGSVLVDGQIPWLKPSEIIPG